MLKEPVLETEAYNNHVTFSQSLLADQYNCTKYPEHAALISWYSGDPPPPMYLPDMANLTTPSTSHVSTFQST